MKDVKSVDTLANLRAIPAPEEGTIVLVAGYWAPEDGGGGMFRWYAFSLEADDAALVIQATGVTAGRWHRMYERGQLNVKWFGTPGNDGKTVGPGSPIGTGADDAGIQAALAAIRKIAPARGKNLNDGAILNFPPGTYKLTQTLTLDRCITLRGTGRGNWSLGAALRWNGTSHGIIVVGTAVLSHNRGDSSVIEGLTLTGSPVTPTKTWTTAELNDSITNPGAIFYEAQPACGIVIHSNRVRVQDCAISMWNGDGIHIEAIYKPPYEKNANDWCVRNVLFSQMGRHGLFCAGDNSNAGIGELITGTGDLGGYTIYDRSFLGNTYVACHSEGARHSYYTDSNVSNSTFIGCYQETSDGPAQLGASTMVVGGVWGNGIKGNPTIMASVPGEGVGFLRGISKVPRVSPVRIFKPGAQYFVTTPDADGFISTMIIDTAFTGTIIIPLPADNVKGREFTFKRVDSNTGVHTTLRPVAQTGYKLEGVLNGSFLLYGGKTVTLLCDGKDWHVINKF